MTDLATAEAPETPSTVLDTGPEAGPAGAGAPRTLAEPEDKGPSLRDMIAEEVKKDAEPKSDEQPEAEGDKAPEKVKTEKTPDDAKEPPKGAERGADGKFKAKEGEPEEAKAAPETKSEAKPAEETPDAKPNSHIEPPKAFLPDAKETWRNTPRAVQRDVENMARTHEAELTRYREGAERYESVRQYDEMARQSGRAGVHESLAEVVRLENLMRANPTAALNEMLLRAGPRKADGQPISLFELAQAIVNTGQDGYRRMIAQQPQNRSQPQANPEVAQLKAQIAKLHEQQMAATVIEPFRVANPRYDELQDDIAFFLGSGRIPDSLSPSDRLAAAYDMAVRINPASHANGADSETDPEPARRADDPSAAAKSIKSAPGAVSAEMEPERGGSIRELLAQELKRAKGSR